MKTLIVYTSVHHQNTEKVAKVMAEELGADLVSIGQAVRRNPVPSWRMT